jgi:hypothetical protein
MPEAGPTLLEAAAQALADLKAERIRVSGDTLTLLRDIDRRIEALDAALVRHVHLVAEATQE